MKKNIFGLIILFIFVLNLLSCSNFKNFFSFNAYRKGIKAEREGNLELACQYYIRDIKKYPTKTRSRTALADVFYTKAYLKKNQNTDTLADWKNALITNEIAFEIESDSNRKNVLISCYVNIINKKIEEKDYNNAMKYIETSSKYLNDDKTINVIKAKLYDYIENTDSELAVYKNILAQDTGNEIALINMSNLLLNKGDTVSAKEYLFKAFELNKKSIVVNKNIAYLFLKNNDYANSIKYYINVLELNPNDVESLNNLAFCYTKTGDYYLALRNFEKALELTPIDSDIYLNIGKMFYQQENYQNAIDNFKKALLLKESNFDALVSLALAYQKFGQIDEAISTFEKIIQINKEFYLAYDNLIFIYKKYKNNQVMVDFYLAKYKKVNNDGYEKIIKYLK